MSALASWQHWVRLRDGTRTAAAGSERRAPCWLLGEEISGRRADASELY